MEMLRDSGPGRFTKIGTNVQTRGRVGFLQDAYAPAHRLLDVQIRLQTQFRRVAAVLLRKHQNMPDVVRILI